MIRKCVFLPVVTFSEFPICGHSLESHGSPRGAWCSRANCAYDINHAVDKPSAQSVMASGRGRGST
jgi:hypothetical protein